MSARIFPFPNLRPLLPSYLADEIIVSGEVPLVERERVAAYLRSQLRACAAYIPAPLVRERLRDPSRGQIGGAYWQGSLLFADMSGFTALSEKLSVLGKQGAEEISAIINQLFTALLDELHACGGVLLKFGGDALTAFFAEESLGRLHATAAARAALAMQERMTAFAAIESRAGRFRLGLRVGVHSGRVFAAQVGDSEHIELVVTGSEVNRVAMAQEIATPGEVVLTQQTAELLTGATLDERSAGFLHLLSLQPMQLPDTNATFVPTIAGNSLPELELGATQLAALQPYLVRGLPGRFLESAESGPGEFRPVTVLFANFHDFSAMLTQLGEDVDTAARVLNAYYQRAQAVIHRYGGIINKVDMYTHGDKLMALFGAPTAHEDDPQRAARAALELQQALVETNEEIASLVTSNEKGVTGAQSQRSELVTRHSSLVTLAQKIGLNTGTVFAGRVGGAQRYEYTVMGPAVNLAARLMSAAPEGAIILSPATRSSLASTAQLQELAPLQLKGLAEPVVPARLLGIGASTERNRVARGEFQPAPLVGRTAELARCLAASNVALRGQGRVITIVGEAGAGKSRLADELLRKLIDPLASEVPPFGIISGECQSYEQRTPYAALRGLLRTLLRLEGVLNPEAVLASVQRFAPTLERFAPLLGDVLGINLPETSLTEALTPQQRHERSQELVVALCCGAATREPVLLLLDDVQWSDSSSLELLARLAQAINAVPLLLVLCYRAEPPIPAPWDGLATTEQIVLADLSPESRSELLGHLLGGKVPNEVLGLFERTQGNPFFIEELVRALLVSQTLEATGSDGWRLTRPLDQVAVPTSIEGLLIARLDRLHEAQYELIQSASVIGRRFETEVLAGVYDRSEPLDQGLNGLINNDMLTSEELDAYLFRHALLRDVAYEGILFARRRSLHRRVAERLETLSDTNRDEVLALLGWHYSQAEIWPLAFDYLLRAGVQAQQRYANRDALALLDAAQVILPNLASEREPAWITDHRSAIHERRGDLHVLLGEYDQAENHYLAALALVATGSAGHLRLHRLLATVEERRSHYEAAFTWLHKGMDNDVAVDEAEQARCYLLGAGLYFRQGAYQDALQWANMGYQIAEKLGDQAGQGHALQLLGAIQNDQGEFNASVPRLEQACTLFEQLNNVTGLGNALNNLGMAYLQLGRWRDTVRCYERSLALCESIGDVQAMARTANNLAVVLVARNQLDRAAELYAYSSEQFGKIGSVLGVAVTRYNRGEVLLHKEQPAEALALFNQSIATLEQIGARTFLSEVLRLAAEAWLAVGDLEQAEAAAQRSLALANDLGLAVEGAIAQRVLGQIALAQGNLAVASDKLEESAAALEKLDNRYELAKALRWQAALAQAQQHNQQALALLGEAEHIFNELDAQRDLLLVRAAIRKLTTDD
jgi:class 3 adenylate cyclase/tetratricopeptide (TPR) repeat protein